MAKKTRCVFDTNICIDFFEQRLPFEKEANELVRMVEFREIEGVICANSITTIFYLLKRSFDKQRALIAIEMLLKLFDIAPVDKRILQNAQSLKAKDFEDAVIIASAEQYQVDAIITRNTKDFQCTHLPVYTSQEAVAWMKSLAD
ncbi:MULTISPECIES: type II toxin-antitoxin system VapC family toxin [unclassified Moraxella]|uniref:type II toxin-antitoxin system VapC family toxin n=1 Tax=unclassified Moraxella TaxID=2685852 RepID=UPI003AF45F8B